MSLFIQNLKKLTHFDDHGELFFKINCSIILDEKGVVQEMGGQLTPKKSDTIIDGAKLIGLAPFVDCHSHALFAGNRAAEFQLKCQGVSYVDIAKSGGGILSTQKATQAASDDELIKLTSERIEKFISQGVRGLEIKTGYGLNHEQEIRHLKILQNVKKKFAPQIQLWVTYLGPHAVMQGINKEEYLTEICEKTLPLIAKDHLTDFVDIFVDEGFFSAQDMDRYCGVAKKLGLKIKAHIDEIKNLNGSTVAAQYGVVSVDHCRHTTIEQLQNLAQHNVQVVFLPCTSFYIDEGFVSMDMVRKSGARPALSLDYNPGTQPSLWWSFLLYLGMKKMGMTEDELIYSTTVAPLKALGENTKDWSLGIGKKCKLNLFDASSVTELAYRYGENLLWKGIFN